MDFESEWTEPAWWLTPFSQFETGLMGGKT